MLTKRQKQILDYIKKFVKEKDYAPSLEEIGKRFWLAKSTVHQHIETLRAKGYLKKIDNQPRSIELNEKKKKFDLVEVPLLGIIAAGEPIEAFEDPETIEVPKSQLSKTGEHFALKVQGDSMIDEGIFDGDTVVIRKQLDAENGETVVALINNNEVTLKKIYKERNGFRLQPANPELKPIFTRELTVQGKVVSVIRSFEELKENIKTLHKGQFVYPNTKILKRERKVRDRELKEKIRGGTKYRNRIIINKTPEEINKFTNKIICGDSEEVLKQFPENSIDIIITSPPYNFGLEYKNDKKNDAVKWDEYFKKLNAIWKECSRVLKPGGRLCVNVQPLFSDYIPTHHYISKELLNLGLLWKGEILWDKHNYNCKYTAWGSWKSPSMPYLKYTWEFIEIFCKETHKKSGDSKNIDITADQFKKWVYAKWDIAPERNMKQYEHPAMFPEELVVRLLKLFSYKNDIVLDPFNGVGTTTAVTRKLNRRYIGIDISKEYCKGATQRLKETLF
jgi:SOS regulatory protein LexA